MCLHVRAGITGVQFDGEFAVCLLDLELRGRGRHAEGVIVCGFYHHSCVYGWSGKGMAGCAVSQSAEVYMAGAAGCCIIFRNSLRHA